MYKHIYLLFLVFLTFSNNLLAQDKFEKERRIKQEEVPSKALSFMNSVNFNPKIKWYEEEGLTRKSIEAKFKNNRSNYSVEFDTLGNVEDIEIEVRWQDIESPVRDAVSLQLKSDCSKHNIDKVQTQFTGNDNHLISLLITGTSNDYLKIKYEIIVKCNYEKTVDLFEYLFDENGQLVSRSKIIFRNSSHLEY